jgi:hypothetical protein
MNSSSAKIYDIFYDESISSVVMKWKGYSTSSQFRKGTELMLETLTKSKSCKVLADIKEMVIIGLEDQKWLETDFLPRAIANGFKAIALVRPSNYFNAVALESMLRQPVLSLLQIRVFNSYEEASEWLLHVNC